MSSNEPRKRLKAAESRRALLDAGRELLDVRGVAPGLDRVTLKEAIEVSGVPRSTAYRLYEGGKGQLEEFRADLLNDLDNGVDTDQIATTVEQAYNAARSAIDSSDPSQRAAGLRAVIRAAVEATMVSIVDSLEWRVYMSSLASIGTGADSDPNLTEVFRAEAVEFGQRFARLFERAAADVGLQARAPFSVADLGALAGAIVEGVALRHQVASTGTTSPTDWSGAVTAIEGLLVCGTEPNPDAPASADLSTWTSWG